MKETRKLGRVKLHQKRCYFVTTSQKHSISSRISRIKCPFDSQNEGEEVKKSAPQVGVNWIPGSYSTTSYKSVFFKEFLAENILLPGLQLQDTPGTWSISKNRKWEKVCFLRRIWWCRMNGSLLQWLYWAGRAKRLCLFRTGWPLRSPRAGCLRLRLCLRLRCRPPTAALREDWTARRRLRRSTAAAGRPSVPVMRATEGNDTKMDLNQCAYRHHGLLNK